MKSFTRSGGLATEILFPGFPHCRSPFSIGVYQNRPVLIDKLIPAAPKRITIIILLPFRNGYPCN